MLNNPEKLSSFSIGEQPNSVKYVETQQVKDGVECDVYTFEDDNTRDLAIVRVAGGFKTPLQRVLKGDKTIEGFLDGKAALTVVSKDGRSQKYTFESEEDKGKEVDVSVGQTMQWSADETTGLVFYEICEPSYEDGRFEILPE